MKKVRVGRSRVAGLGVFVVEGVKKGETILLMSGREVSDKDIDEKYEEGDLRWDDPFEFWQDKYLLLDEVPLRINHSCAPNAGIRGKNELFALRAIQKGEELSYDYSTVVGKNAPGE